MLYEDEGVGEDVICSAVEPSCPECPPGEDSVSSMPACMSEDEGPEDENANMIATCIGHIRHLNEKGHRFGRDCYLEFWTDVLGMVSLVEVATKRSRV